MKIKLYSCDPKKNKDCAKTSCYFNKDLSLDQRLCSQTTHKEFAREEAVDEREHDSVP